MSDPVIGLLRRFTPRGTLPDRDRLMYEAGRASVPSSLRWKVFTGLLALTQVLTLLLMPASPSLRRPTPPQQAPIEYPGEREPAQQAGIWALQEKLLQGEDDLGSPPSDFELLPEQPPLRVFTSWRTFSLD